ncbi:MAG: PLP-dependent aminotransferase family protein [Mogibacterium sp.]|nr:PLP-dependent aminotransferase family protein [Mogibacterium sp.]
MSTKSLFSEHYKDLGPSFIATILQTAVNPENISFAGGLPNPISFPKEALKESSVRIIETYGPSVFQYSSTEGLPELRQFLADKFNKKLNWDLTIDNIIITSGSQQALDIIPRLLIDKGDGIIVENPSYLGGLQAFNQYQPTYYPVDLHDDGLDLEQLEAALQQENVKFCYLIPEFQNPTGLTYTNENRAKVSELFRKYNVILVEDDPYGELRFEGEHGIYVGMKNYENSVLLGTFSKSVTPGMRLGYIISKNTELMAKFSMAKENSDLHSNIFAQYLIYDYMTHNDHQAHIDEIVDLYRSQAHAMISAMEKYLPADVKFTRPEGGMFMWATLPEGKTAMDLFYKALDKGVVFVPGIPFYAGQPSDRTLRLNFTNETPENIELGVKRLAEAMKEI